MKPDTISYAGPFYDNDHSTFGNCVQKTLQEIRVQNMEFNFSLNLPGVNILRFIGA